MRQLRERVTQDRDSESPHENVKSPGQNLAAGVDETYAIDCLLMLAAPPSIRFSDSSTCSLFVYMYFLASWVVPHRVSLLVCKSTNATVLESL